MNRIRLKTKRMELLNQNEKKDRMMSENIADQLLRILDYFSDIK